MVNKAVTLFLGLTALLAGCAAGTETTSAPVPVAAYSPSDICKGGEFTVHAARDVMDVVGTQLVNVTLAWNRQMSGKVGFHLVVDDATRPVWNQCEVQVVWATESLPGDAWGQTRWAGSATGEKGGAVVYLNPRIIKAESLTPPDERDEVADVSWATLLHEFGHVLGLAHDDVVADNTAMRTFITVPAGIGCVDVRLACSVWGCTPGCTGNDWTTAMTLGQPLTF